jgi:hypothetical protein
MSIINLITTVSLAVALITMATSNQLSIYATPTSEDDGWVEGDYEGSLEEQEEQAQEDWEDAGRPGEIEDENDDDENDNENNNDNSEELVECEDGSLVETEELCEQSEALVLCSDGSYAATQAECPPEPVLSFVTCLDGSSAATQAECPPEPVSSFITCSDGSTAVTQTECPSAPTAAAQEQLQTCQDGSSVSLYEECPPESEPLPKEQLTCPDGSVVSINEACPPTDKPLPDCDGSFQDCITPYGDICPAGSAAHECELPLPEEQVQCSDGSTAESQELCPTEQLVQSKTCPNGVVVAVIQDCPLPDKELTQKEQQEWNKSCGDAGEQAGESGQAFSKEAYQHCGDEATGDKEYLKGFIAGCMKQDDMNEEDCSAETDRLKVWGNNPPTNQLHLERSGKPCNPGYVNIGNNLHVNCERIKDDCKNVPFYMTCEKHSGDDEKTKVIQKTTVIDRSSASASATATTTVNAAEVSTCKLNGNTDGLQYKFDSIKHRACGLYPNGQIAYSDGFVVGCTQAGNTQQLCQAFVIMNTQQTQTATTQPQTQPTTQSTTQPTQTLPSAHSTHAIQPSAVN